MLTSFSMPEDSSTCKEEIARPSKRFDRQIGGSQGQKIHNKKSAVDEKEILLRTCSPESISKQNENLQLFSSRCLQCGFARAALTDHEKTERKVWKNRISVERLPEKGETER
jgi:ferredoxin-like protein FixX